MCAQCPGNNSQDSNRSLISVGTQVTILIMTSTLRVLMWSHESHEGTHAQTNALSNIFVLSMTRFLRVIMSYYESYCMTRSVKSKDALSHFSDYAGNDSYPNIMTHDVTYTYWRQFFLCFLIKVKYIFSPIQLLSNDLKHSFIPIIIKLPSNKHNSSLSNSQGKNN